MLMQHPREIHRSNQAAADLAIRCVVTSQYARCTTDNHFLENVLLIGFCSCNRRTLRLTSVHTKCEVTK